MEKKPSQDLLIDHHHQQQALKCPRCDSANTKFCYYNNYSLSQPRHFCKACKRYWTRGGTLRNVPVGGGCRKNKRMKTSSISLLSSAPAPTHSSSTTHTTLNRVNPLLFNQSDITIRLPRLASTGYDLESQLNAFEFGFSSPNIVTTALSSCGYESRANYNNGKDYKTDIDPTTQLSHLPTLNSHLPNFPFFLGSPSSTSKTCFIPSSLQQQSSNLDGLKQGRPSNYFEGLRDQMTTMKEVKIEEGNNQLIENTTETMGFFESSAYWNSTNAGAWPDLSNYGSSVTSLI